MNKMQTEPIAPADTAEIEKHTGLRKSAGRNWTRTILMLIVPALLIIGGAYLWLTSGGSVSTDDAQVKQDIVSVSPQVNGQIVAVLLRNGTVLTWGSAGYLLGSGVEAIVINTPTEPFNHQHPDELRIPADDPSVPYKWKP